MQFSQRRSVQHDSGRRSRVSRLECLEPRVVLSGFHPVSAYGAAYVPSDLRVTNPITRQPELVSVRNLSKNTLTSNEGKIVSGVDREGDAWTITVHGPGKVIVTDTTPNDGTLDDDIATIQLVGTSINSTYVTGNIVASPRSESNLINSTEGQSDQTILFNRLIANSGVRSIELNGFTLTRQVTPAVDQSTGILLYGGVRVLSFKTIDGLTDTSVNSTPIDVIIGNTTNPLPAGVQPSIYLDSIVNTVFDGTATSTPTVPLTTPNVSFQINGTVRDFSIVSATHTTIPAAYQFQYPVVGTTGRTSLQAHAVKNLSVVGSATNFTASRSAIPFQSNSTGLKYLRRASFGGNADGVGLDVRGTINHLTFKKGLGNPTGVFTGTDSNGNPLPATSYGYNQGSTGYPASGYLGGVVSARRIRRVNVGAANVNLQTPTNPAFNQLQGAQTQTYIATPGNALTSSAIVTSGSMGNVHIVGDQVNSEVKTGFYYSQYAAGLEGTRAASRIRHLNQQGSLINSVDSASVRPNSSGQYVHGQNKLGRGAISGQVTGQIYNTGGTTALGNTGAGVYARFLGRRLRVKQTG